MSVEAEITVMFITGMLMGAMIGGFLICCLVVSDDKDEESENSLKLLKVYNLIHSDFGLYDFELIKKINDIIEGDEHENS